MKKFNAFLEKIDLNKKQLFIGGGMMLLLAPVVVAGYVTGFLKQYFNLGMTIFDDYTHSWIIKKLSK